mmetsp:Transcript_16109/g.26198  ORF Transcript_16109/g.26198 Transcript_16109/m.26198 type:complete len:216 (+) Transcript_16109:56-703(+)
MQFSKVQVVALRLFFIMQNCPKPVRLSLVLGWWWHPPAAQAPLLLLLRPSSLSFGQRPPPQPQTPPPQPPSASQAWPLARVISRVAKDSASVGWMPTISSKSAFLAPSLRVSPKPWVISPAFGPTKWKPRTRSSSVLRQTSLLRHTAGRSTSSSASGPASVYRMVVRWAACSSSELNSNRYVSMFSSPCRATASSSLSPQQPYSKGVNTVVATRS